MSDYPSGPNQMPYNNNRYPSLPNNYPQGQAGAMGGYPAQGYSQGMGPVPAQGYGGYQLPSNYNHPDNPDY